MSYHLNYLRQSLLKIVEPEHDEVSAPLRQAFIEIALALSKAILDYQMYKVCLGRSMKDLEELTYLKPKKAIS